MAVKARSETKHYLYVSLTLVVLGLGILAIFQNCAIHSSGVGGGASSNCTNMGNDIEMIIGGAVYYENVLAPSDVIFRVSDPQASTDLKWFLTHINNKGSETFVLKKPVSGSELTHTFDSRESGKYTVRAEDKSGEDCYSYQKNLTLITKIDAVLGYSCPQGMVRASVPNTPPSAANCHSGESVYPIGIKLKNEFSSSCTIKARSGSITQTLQKANCNTQNSELTLNIPNSSTNNTCKTVKFDITAANATDSYTVYYKIDNTGFKLGKNSSWCGGSTTATTPNPGNTRGETCYVLSQNCYTPLNSAVYSACRNRFRQVDVSASCSDEYSLCTVYDCQSEEE